MARPAGFEPATHALEGRCSIQMSYGRIVWSTTLTELPYCAQQLNCGRITQNKSGRDREITRGYAPRPTGRPLVVPIRKRIGQTLPTFYYGCRDFKSFSVTGYPPSRHSHRVAFNFGRGREIRTPDILLPKQARYQTALYPELRAGIIATVNDGCYPLRQTFLEIFLFWK